MHRRTAALLAIVFSFCFMRGQEGRAQDITGDWRGELKGYGLEVLVILHVSKTADGSLAGTVTFPTVGGRVSPITATSSGTKVGFRAEGVQAFFEGNVNADDSVISGVWTDSGRFDVELRRFTVAAKNHGSVKRSDIDGYWVGTLKTNLLPDCDPSMSETRFVFHIVSTAEGLTAIWDNLINGEKGWVATSVTRDHAALDIEMKQSGARFNGTINGQKTVIAGTWSLVRFDNNYPFVLTRVKHPPKPEPVLTHWCSGNGI
jgi:hypothetical protein